MRSARFAGLFCILLSLALGAAAQQTMARLALANGSAVDHDIDPAVPRTSASLHETTPSPSRYTRQSVGLQDTPLSRAAAQALFVHSDVERARVLSIRALNNHRDDLEAMFVRMEVAIREANSPIVLDLALRLCEYGAPASDDPRVQLAAAQIRNAAANTLYFRHLVPQIQKLVANWLQPWPELDEALLRAAMDGVPNLDAYALSRRSGILTDWRIVGPFGRRALAEANSEDLSRNENLDQSSVLGRTVENFQFPDGAVVLPDYLAHHGIYYAAARFASLAPGTWTLHVQAPGTLEIYIDGAPALKKIAAAGTSLTRSADIELAPGPHRVLVRFSGGPAFRVMVRPQQPAVALAAQPWVSAQELAFERAAASYADVDDFLLPGRSTSESARLPVPGTAPLARQFDSGESVNGPSGAAAELQSSEVHPSCSNLQRSIAGYRSIHQLEQARALLPRLQGCAPESLAYAQALSEDSRHAEAAAILQKLLLAAPLNRAAQFMLIHELQLAGDDLGAQRAAVQWVRIAPNSGSYRRLAASADEVPDGPTAPAAPFYAAFRRGADTVFEKAVPHPGGDVAVLMDDHIAIARADGSVSLYVHRISQALTGDGAAQLAQSAIPQNAQTLADRMIRYDAMQNPVSAADASLLAGDSLEQEYVIHYAGDGGIPEHPEAFQFVFGRADETVQQARFIVLTPASASDRGAVIVTGEAPPMTSTVSSGELARSWEIGSAKAYASDTFAIVRVVDQENGWTVPRSAERRKRIETSHPGPRLLDAALSTQKPEHHYFALPRGL